MAGQLRPPRQVRPGDGDVDDDDDGDVYTVDDGDVDDGELLMVC